MTPGFSSSTMTRRTTECPLLRRWALRLLAVECIALLRHTEANNGEVETEEEIRVEDWFNMFRFQVALGVVIFGIHLIFYTDVSMYCFLRQYRNQDLKEDTLGTVISCEEASGYHKKYEITVLYSAIEPTLKGDPRKNSVPKEFIFTTFSDWNTPRGTSIKLCCIKGRPRSARTYDEIEKEERRLESLLYSRGFVVLIPAVLLLVCFLIMSAFDILKFKSAKTHFLGWTLMLLVVVGSTIFSRWICHRNYYHLMLQTYLAATPIKSTRASSAYKVKGESDSKNEPLIDPESNMPVAVLLLL